MPRNAVIAQSGGPSPVINCSLQGVIEASRTFPGTFGKLYGARHGIEGVLREELIDLNIQDDREIALLSTTPAAGAVGTCRYKLRAERPEDFERVIEVFKAHDIGYFFYNGGNDSMDTAHKISCLANERGLDLTAVGIPKTVDNDLGDPEFSLIDHTPGYGSAARFWAYSIQNMNEENRGSMTSDPVLVLQVMGRSIGFLPAAVRLGDPERRMPLQIYMAESGLSLDDICDNVNDELKTSGRCIVVISEGFPVGDIGARQDAFGHVEFEASDRTAQQVVTKHLNDKGLPAKGFARGQVAGTLQRATSIHASTVDMSEAYEVGQKAVRIAVEDGDGYMSTIQRTEDASYKAYFGKVSLEKIANSERSFPQHWLSDNRIDVNDEFIEYASPLIGDEWPIIPIENGIQRFARLKPVLAEQKCRKYNLNNS
ncbi:MAG: diphosphate--fructose-6-phosphate 1-phosphotransferase [Verrucomicrobiota bacterium]